MIRESFRLAHVWSEPEQSDLKMLRGWRWTPPHFIATATAILASALAAAGTGVASGVIGSKAAKGAAATQAAAARNSAELQAQSASESTALQKQMFEQSQSNLAPWLQAGGEALGKLKDFPEWTKTFTGVEPYTPNKFDPNTVNFDPGFQKRMDQSNKALQAWAASRGQLLSGGTGTRLVQNAQDLTSGEYNNAYNRTYGAFNADEQRRQQAQSQTFGQQFGAYQQGFNEYQDQWQRLAQLSGVGLNTAGSLNQFGQNYANTVGSINTATAANIGQAGEAGAAATAAGQVGGANAVTSALGGIANNVGSGLNLALLLQNPQILNNQYSRARNNVQYYGGGLTPGYSLGGPQ